MNIKEGGMYLDGRGYVIGPMRRSDANDGYYEWTGNSPNEFHDWHYSADGFFWRDKGRPQTRNLVSEYVIEPEFQPTYTGEWEDAIAE